MFDTDPSFAPHLGIAAAAGFRGGAVHAFAYPQRRTARHDLDPLPQNPSSIGVDLRFTDLYARQAAEMIERGRAEAALRQSEEQFRLLAEAIPHQVWGYLPDGSLSYCNQQWMDYSGLTPEGRATRAQARAAFIRTTVERIALMVWAAGRDRHGGPTGWKCACGGPTAAIAASCVACGRRVYDARGQLVQWFGTEHRCRGAQAGRSRPCTRPRASSRTSPGWRPWASWPPRWRTS